VSNLNETANIVLSGISNDGDFFSEVINSSDKEFELSIPSGNWKFYGLYLDLSTTTCTYQEEKIQGISQVLVIEFSSADCSNSAFGDHDSTEFQSMKLFSCHDLSEVDANSTTCGIDKHGSLGSYQIVLNSSDLSSVSEISFSSKEIELQCVTLSDENYSTLSHEIPFGSKSSLPFLVTVKSFETLDCSGSYLERQYNYGLYNSLDNSSLSNTSENMSTIFFANAKKANGKQCLVGLECISNYCDEGFCINVSCEDEKLNGDETAIDCGGSCGPCASGAICERGGDCDSGICLDQICQIQQSPHNDNYVAVGYCPVVISEINGLFANDQSSESSQIMIKSNADGNGMPTLSNGGVSELDFGKGSFIFAPSTLDSDSFSYSITLADIESTDEATVTISNSESDPVIIVTTTQDELNEDGDCSLREAIDAANTNKKVDNCSAGQVGRDVIVFSQSDLGIYTYDISLAGFGENNNETGDFDITEDLNIVGCGPSSTIINAQDEDRTFHILGAATEVNFIGITIKNGSVTGDYGGLIYNEGNLNLTFVTLSDGEAIGENGDNKTTASGGDGGGSEGGVGGNVSHGGDGLFASGGGGGAGSGRGLYGGGDGGFGGGGGGGGAKTFGGNGELGGSGGFGSGQGGKGHSFGSGAGGGGAGLGGAIFNNSGEIIIEQCDFFNNTAVGGSKGSDNHSINHANGNGHGGAIFNYEGTLTELGATSTYTDNLADDFEESSTDNNFTYEAQ